MTARTFTGSADTNASNPANWSPNGAPKAGDSLTWSDGGTMDVTKNALAGDTLTLGGASSSQDFVINVSGRARFHEVAAFPPIGVGAITINLADHSRWIGGFSSNLAGGVFITGDGRFANQNSTVAAKSTVDVNVVGHGTFRVESAQSVPGELEFTKSVSKGQSITVGGDPARDVSASVTVDHPSDFHAATTLGFGVITLDGLTADSYSLKNDMLLLYSGSKVVDRLDLTVSPSLGAMNFGVSQTMAGIVVHANDGTAPGTPLPVH